MNLKTHRSLLLVIVSNQRYLSRNILLAYRSRFASFFFISVKVEFMARQIEQGKKEFGDVLNNQKQKVKLIPFLFT